MSEIRLAPRLAAGDAIGIFSPSCPATAWIPERTQLAIAYLEGHGHPVVRGSLTGKAEGYRSGGIAARAEELNELIRDPRVKCIMASAGGFVSNSILPHIDYEALRRCPKIVVGFSDVTAILLAVYAKTGLVTFLGPNLIPVFGEVPPYADESYDHFRAVAFGEYRLPHAFPVPRAWTEDSVGLEEAGVACEARANELVCVREGVAEGRLLGGNLNTLSGIFGSSYMPEIREGDILYLEENRGYPESIERSISMLELSGVFRRIGGLIFGKCADYDAHGIGKSFWEVSMETLGKYAFPILAEFDCAHTRPMLTLPIGCRVRLNARMSRVELLEDAVARRG